MPDYLSAFEPVRPVTGIPTPDPNGAAAVLNQGMSSWSNNIQENKRTAAKIKAEKDMQSQRLIAESMTNASNQITETARLGAQQKHEKNLQAEQLKAAAARDKDRDDRFQAWQQRQAQAEKYLNDSRARANSVGRMRGITGARMAALASAGNNSATSLATLAYMEQAMKGNPLNKMIGSAFGAGGEAPATGNLSSKSPSSGWSKIWATQKENGKSWAEQRASNPFQGINLLGLLEDPAAAAHLARGSDGIIDILDGSGHKVAAQTLRTMKENFNGDKVPGPQDIKKMVPGALAENAFDWMTKASQELASLKGAQGVPGDLQERGGVGGVPENLKRGIDGALRDMENMGFKYYGPDGPGHAFLTEELNSHDASSGIFDKLAGYIDTGYLKQKVEQGKVASDWLTRYPAELAVQAEDEFHLKYSRIEDSAFNALLRGDMATFNQMRDQGDALTTEYSKKIGSMAPPPPMPDYGTSSTSTPTASSTDFDAEAGRGYQAPQAQAPQAPVERPVEQAAPQPMPDRDYNAPSYSDFGD